MRTRATDWSPRPSRSRYEWSTKPASSYASNRSPERSRALRSLGGSRSPSTADILEIAELGAIEVISLYVTKPGGLWRARQQSIVAESVGLISDIGGSIEMGIGNAANLQLGAAAPIAQLPSVCPVSAPKGTREGIAGAYYTDDLVAAPFALEEGALIVPDGPGLGIEVDEEKIQAYAR
jgi:muconate cycloisomerase